MERDIAAQKAQLRKECLRARCAMTPLEKAEADAALCRGVAEHPAFTAADLLLCFFAVRGEPDLSSLFETALKRGVKIAFPRCEGVQMHFHLVSSVSELQPGRFGIPTPHESAPRAIPSARTLCLLPALAATRDGARLGYGGGFYDRFLAGFQGRTLLPIYEKLILPTLPCEATDLCADVILTEKGVLYPRA